MLFLFFNLLVETVFGIIPTHLCARKMADIKCLVSSILAKMDYMLFLHFEVKIPGEVAWVTDN